MSTNRPAEVQRALDWLSAGDNVEKGLHKVFSAYVASLESKLEAAQAQKLMFAAHQLRVFAPHPLIDDNVSRHKIAEYAKELEDEARALTSSKRAGDVETPPPGFRYATTEELFTELAIPNPKQKAAILDGYVAGKVEIFPTNEKKPQ